MKRFIMVAAVAATCLAIPGSALAQGTRTSGDDCGYATDNAAPGEAVDPAGGTVVVYAHQTDNTSGMAGTADTAVGACMDNDPAPTAGPFAFGGGTVEAGTGTDDPMAGGDGSGTYAVVDGDNQNADPAGQGDGYAGVSTYEDGNKGNCTGGGTKTNSGGSSCVDADPSRSANTPVVCGNTSGNVWASTSRDGCSIP